ncbi:50S ribosomal protein [Dirofilaria immitis]
MDFDPDNPKWLCCCWQLPNGLMILASSEIIISLMLSMYSATYIAMSNSEQLWFMITLTLISIMYGIASALLFIGIRKLKENLMYPTLAARAILIIFLQLFGVSTAIQPTHSIDNENWREMTEQKIHKNLVKKKMENEPTIAQRLILLIFFMLLISIFVFYTLYLIVRCIHYVKAYKRLMRRKHSLIVACRIDLTDNRHNSVFPKKSTNSA